MGRFLAIAIALGTVGACKDKSKSEGLPPAQEWSANAGDLAPAQQPGAAARSNPHAGNNPHAGVPGAPDLSEEEEGGGLPAGHPPIDQAHGGGMGGSGDMAAMAPDPDRAIDPTKKISGVIKVHPKVKDKVTSGATIFISVKRSVDGAPSGFPLAAEKLTWGKGDLPFELTDAQAMVKGTEFTGEVVVTAWVDHDGDASTKTTGDVIGSMRLKIPAEKVAITLDDVIP